MLNLDTSGAYTTWTICMYANGRSYGIDDRHIEREMHCEEEVAEFAAMKVSVTKG